MKIDDVWTFSICSLYRVRSREAPNYLLTILKLATDEYIANT